jgi:hypothetical protein
LTRGWPLLAYIQKNPLGAAIYFQHHYGDVACLNILFRRIYCFFKLPITVMSRGLPHNTLRQTKMS